MDRLLDHDAIFQTVKADLFQRYPRTRTDDVARQTGAQAADALKTTYGDLIQLTETVVAQTHQTLAVAGHRPASANAAAQRLAGRREELLPRVLQGESVPATEKSVSLFTSHTTILCMGKPGNLVAFGRMIWLAEVEGGSITHISGAHQQSRRGGPGR